MNPSQFSNNARASYVQDMFARIAHRYDLMNRLMSAGQDVRWRKEVIHRASLTPGCCLLDLGAGTGDLAREAARQQPTCRVIAADFTMKMMRVGQKRGINPQNRATPFLSWCSADALRLPFPNETFDAVVSGFLMRNVADIDQCLAEQYRVLKQGGRIVTLDTTRPRSGFFTPVVQMQLRLVIPTLGRWLSGQADAYAYLPGSTQSFLTAEQLAARLSAAGLQQVGFHRQMFGTIAIHWATKPFTPGLFTAT